MPEARGRRFFAPAVRISPVVTSRGQENDGYTRCAREQATHTTREMRRTVPHMLPETPPDFDDGRVIERPDGFYWQSKRGGREYGPFGSLLEAAQDMQESGESSFEPGETTEEAKAEIGIADWSLSQWTLLLRHVEQSLVRPITARSASTAPCQRYTENLRLLSLQTGENLTAGFRTLRALAHRVVRRQHATV